MSCDLKLNDLLELSKVYAPEYNMPELHDRVLVFDIMQDGWETSAILDVASKDLGNESVAVDEKSGESSTTVPNDAAQVQQSVRNEEQSNSGFGIEVQNEPNNLVANEETKPVESSSPAEQLEHSEKDLIRQHKLYVHSSWLAVQSKYFRSLFYSGMKESRRTEVHVKVPESEEATHLMLLEAIYKADILNGASVEELLAVLELADKYDVKFVFKKCKYVLQTRVTTVDICKQVMHVIKEKHNFADVEDLAATMQETMGGSFSPLENHWETENFTSQSQPFVKYLLASSKLTTGCENTVFQALMHWMEINNVDPASLEEDSGILKSVRFEKISIDYLYNVVRVHPIASKMPGFQELMLKGMTYHALTPELKQRLGEVTPRQRQPNVFNFSWNISKTQLITYNATFIDSKTFWLFGYKACIRIQFFSGSVSNDTYGVRLYLTLSQLTSKNCVPLSWKFIGGYRGFQEGTVACCHTFTSSSTSHFKPVTFQKSTVPESTVINITVDEPQ